MTGGKPDWNPAIVNDKTHSGVFFNRFNNQETGVGDMPGGTTCSRWFDKLDRS